MVTINVGVSGATVNAHALAEERNDDSQQRVVGQPNCPKCGTPLRLGVMTGRYYCLKPCDWSQPNGDQLPNIVVDAEGVDMVGVTWRRMMASEARRLASALEYAAKVAEEVAG